MTAKRGRGRPKGSKNKSTILKEAKSIENEKGADWTEGLDDAAVLGTVHTRFDVMNRVVSSCLKGQIRGAVISGAPGIGKTYTVEEALKNRAEASNHTKRHKIIKGSISPIGLYQTLWHYQHPGNVILLDDTDAIFFEDDGVALLKAALDSSPTRWITWNSEAAVLKQNDIPQEFEFNGTMLFITNTDFQGIVDKGKSKLAPHFEALMSRTVYLDLMVHHRRPVAIWVNYMIRRTKMLQVHYGITAEQEKTAITWILDNYLNLRTLSLRDAMKVGQFMKSDPNDWETLAEVTLLREIKAK